MSIISLLLNIKKYGFFYLITKLFSECDFNQQTILSKNLELNKKIAIYGFGPYGQEYFLKLFDKNIISNIYDIKYASLRKYIEHPDTINVDCFDFIIVTVMDAKTQKDVINYLVKKGVPDNQIICIKYRFNSL